MNNNEIILQLQALRSKVRLRLFIYGLCAVFGGGMISFISVLALDWLLWLPPALRILGASLFVIGFLIAMTYWVVRPLRVSMSIEVIADRLERHFSGLRDQLRSTVDFVSRPDTASEAMRQRVIAQTSEKVKNLPIESVLVLQPLAVRVTWLAVGSIAFLLLLMLAPTWIQTGMRRYLNPLGSTEWPRSVAVEPIDGGQVVAIGDAATIRMRVTRGLHESLRPILHFRDAASGEESRLAMQAGDSGEFHATIDAVTRDLVFWFEAGDENTSRVPQLIRAIRRPEVAEALAVTEPPPYASDRSPRSHNLAEGPVRASIGGAVTIVVKPSKPLPKGAADSPAGLRLEDGGWIALTPSTERPESWETHFTVKEDVVFRVELRDEMDFENRAAAQLAVLATPDAPPTVTINEPKSLVECTPKGTVRLVVQIDDDFGISAVELLAEKTGADEQLGSWSLQEQMVQSMGSTGVQGLVQFRWSLATMKLVPGDTISYVVAATDNRVTDQAAGQVARSASQRMKIISEVEFETRLRDDIVMLESRVRQVVIDQVELLDRTSTLMRTDPQAAPLTPEEREALSNLNGTQTRISRRVTDLARRFRDLSEQMELNQSERESINQVHAMATGLQNAAGEPMSSAGKSLVEARDQADVGEQQEAIKKAVDSEQVALGQLQTLLRSMSQWGNFRGLITKTRDLLERQDMLRFRTQELAQATLGKNVSELSASESAALKQAERQQEQLAADLEQLLDRMRQLQGAAEAKDQATADAIDAALRAASAKDVTQRMQTAAEALSSNRTAAAAIDQKNAADGMRSMISAMQEREARELAQLRKRIDKAEEQIANLLREQQALQTATREAEVTHADERAYGQLEQEQHTLRRNAAAISEDLADVAAAESAARLVRQTGTPMGQAVQHLHDQEAQPAVNRQAEAIAFLNEALDLMRQLVEESAKEELRRTLAQIKEDLQAMASAQRAVNDGIGKIKSVIDAAGHIGRSEAREVTRLAREQASVRDMTESLRPDFEQIAVYKWAMERAAGWMEASRGRLDGRKVDDELVQTTSRIVGELERLIAAVTDTESMPMDTEFVESGGDGDGGNGPGQQGTPVPPLTELLVLKNLQTDIQKRTQAVNDEIAKAGSNEARLREMKMIGEDQAELQRLTVAVTRRSRQP